MILRHTEHKKNIKMKKIMMMAVAAAFMCGCSNDGEVSEANVATGAGEAEVRFDVMGNFVMDLTEFPQGSVSNADGVNVRRAALTDEANTMTDLGCMTLLVTSACRRCTKRLPMPTGVLRAYL